MYDWELLDWTWFLGNGMSNGWVEFFCDLASEHYILGLLDWTWCKVCMARRLGVVLFGFAWGNGLDGKVPFRKERGFGYTIPILKSQITS